MGLHRLRGWLILLLAVPVLSDAQEYRLGVSYSLPLHKNLETEVKTEYRHLAQINRNEGMIQFQANWKISEKISTSAGYRYYLQREVRDDEEGSFILEDKNRFSADLSLKSARFDNDLRVGSRFRYQYAVNGRNRQTVCLRVKTTADYRLNKRINPYLSFEPYFYPESRKFESFRLSAGEEIAVRGKKADVSLTAERNRRFTDHTEYFLSLLFEL
jgi:hypothetical protein